MISISYLAAQRFHAVYQAESRQINKARLCKLLTRNLIVKKNNRLSLYG